MVTDGTAVTRVKPDTVSTLSETFRSSVQRAPVFW